jgi:hypothetical protein
LLILGPPSESGLFFYLFWQLSVMPPGKSCEDMLVRQAQKQLASLAYKSSPPNIAANN